MGGGDEPRLELRGGEVDPALQHRAVEAGEGHGVRQLRLVPVARRGVEEERRDCRARPADGQWHLGLLGGARQALGESSRERFEAVVLIEVLAQHIQRRAAGRHRERVPGEGAGLVDRAAGRHQRHEVTSPAVGAHGEPSADDLAERGEVRGDAERLLSAAVRGAEAGDDLIEDEKGPLRVADRPQAFEEALGREDDAHVAGDGLHDDRGDLASVRLKLRADGREVVVAGEERLRGVGGGHAGGVGE